MWRKTFKGYGITDGKNWSDFKVIEFPSKAFEETDVEVAITHCGICGSDLSTLSSEWGQVETPLVVGHEIAGTAVRVGSKVEGIKVGDRVGVSAQISSCLSCKICKAGHENYCPHKVDTYAGKYPDGTRTMGGYSTGIIANEKFVFPVPDGLSNEDAATMMCAGLTVYSPMVQANIGPGKKLGIIGIGGLGHYGVLLGKALGAEVYAFSHSPNKEEDAKKMGVDRFIVTSQKDFYKDLAFEFDLIISTTNVVKDFPMQEFLSMLNVYGRFVSVGIPSESFPPLHVMAFINNAALLSATHIGSKEECMKMLQLAADKKVKPWIELMPMKDVKKAVENAKAGKARYRYVLVQDIEPSKVN